ncbi:MAG: transglycosylase domain-containing protein [Saprospiraceae bacterium]|nr:transglycosylase domain-containing protein [Saprospiraceae bacterium]
MLDLKFNNGEHSGKPAYKRIVRWMWYLAFASILAFILFFFFLSFSDLPSVEQLENPKNELASQIYSEDGELLGRFYTENRVPVDFDQLDPDLIAALIATEDKRYYNHCGIDFRALGRVLVKTILLRQRSSGGASTITQQLAKLLFTGMPASGLARVLQKFKEWIIAVRLERKYTKEEIIAMYLNKFDFLYQSYGIKAAAETYFDTTQDSLEIHQAALLVGMLKNPSLYNPLRRPDVALQRRSVVLKQMQKNGLLTAEAYDSLKAVPLGLRFSRKTHIDGIATYFRMELAKELRGILAREENLKSDGTEYDIYRDGLKIYTTIDAQMQRLAEEVMTDHMEEVQSRFNREWRGLDPWTYLTPDPDDQEIPISVRMSGLEKLIRNSDRYQKLRDHYLAEVIDKIQNAIEGVQFNQDDREILRMVSEEKNPGHLSDLVGRSIITPSLAAGYREVMRSDFWPALVSQWEMLQEATDEIFKKPVEMNVFAYNNRMETDTVMSPLDSIKYHRKFLQTGILAVDPLTGRVKVWIGGINHKYFQFDHIRTDRQVGSTFKPFIYATAIAQQGFSPCYKVYDLAQTIAPGDGNFFLLEPWTPENFTGEYTGELFTLKEGLRKSKNTVSVHLMRQLGDTEPVRGLIHNMGIDSSARYPNGRYRIPKVPSICLGVADLTVLEMTGAYTTFANNGTFVKPYFINRVVDKNGRTLYQSLPEERAALPPKANYVMVEMLRYAAAMYGLESDAGGKTGTTDDYVDGWFMGITPNLVVGTWVGGEDRWIHFRTPYNGQGSRMAKPFFQEFISQLEQREDIGYDAAATFHRPPGELGIELDCSEYDTAEPDAGENPLREDVFSENMFGDELPLDTIQQPPSDRNREQ